MRGSERLTAVALLLLSAAAAVAGTPAAGVRLVALVAMLGAVRWLAGSGAAGGPLGLVRDFASVAVVVAAFMLLQPIIEGLNPARYDALLADLDGRWFASLAATWRGALGRPHWFTDLAYLAYWSFYLLPLGVAVAARARHGPAAFERTAFHILLAFYLCYLGYFLWPAEGPRVPHADEAAVLGGGAISAAVRGFLRSAEATTLDAFPSGHTALAVVPAVLATRLLPRWAPVIWLWAAAVIFATVYISVHYVVDVVAGAALGLAALALAPWLQRVLDRPSPSAAIREPVVPPGVR
jgi:membrane-associated phospholipid phosphatase